MADYVDYKFVYIRQESGYTKIKLRVYHGDYTGPSGEYERDSKVDDRIIVFESAKTIPQIIALMNNVLATQYSIHGTPIAEQTP